MEYANEYEHLRDELAVDTQKRWHFDTVKKSANEHRLELSDDEFKGFLKLQTSGKDINWLMHKMSAYNISFVQALISYITY